MKQKPSEYQMKKSFHKIASKENKRMMRKIRGFAIKIQILKIQHKSFVTAAHLSLSSHS